MLLLNKLYAKFEAIKGAKLLLIFALVLIVFIPIGIGLGYLTGPKLNKDETGIGDSTGEIVVGSKIFREGTVVYINPNNYPGENISFVLKSSGGQELLLKSKDAKLKISEGLSVKVGGVMDKTKDGKQDVLLVEEVIINAAN